VSHHGGRSIGGKHLLLLLLLLLLLVWMYLYR
jgi:cbb3-type cytochrome oxidase subunit 3